MYSRFSSPNNLSFLGFECQNAACYSNVLRQCCDENLGQIMKNIPDPNHQKVTGESLSFCGDPMIWQVTPTKWTALQLKLFNCSLISFIILLIRISAVSSEWKICISWIILTPRPFNFCQQYFTAPIRACSQWCFSPPGMSRGQCTPDSTKSSGSCNELLLQLLLSPVVMHFITSAGKAAASLSGWPYLGISAVLCAVGLCRVISFLLGRQG